MRLKLINEKKKCKHCGWRLGHSLECPAVKNCKHVFVSSARISEDFNIYNLQCVKCLSTTIYIKEFDKGKIKELKDKGYKFI